MATFWSELSESAVLLARCLLANGVSQRFHLSFTELKTQINSPSHINAPTATAAKIIRTAPLPDAATSLTKVAVTMAAATTRTQKYAVKIAGRIAVLVTNA